MIKKLLEKYKLWKLKKNQRTWCWCKNCKNELCWDASFGDTTYTDIDGVVTYTCGKCCYESAYLFDTPVPILLHCKEKVNAESST